MSRKVKIGGGSDGWATWKQSNGQPANIHTTGWEMKFEVDAAGNVSGGNKNDNDASNLKKTYTGTLVNNQMNVTANFSNGQVNQYTGTITGNQFKGTLKVVTAVGSGRAGDWGEMGGTVHFD